MKGTIGEEMKVVVIDDDSLVALSLKTILEASGKIEVTAMGKDGREALSLYQKEMPDVLLMDIRMKEMNGIEAGKRVLKAFPEAKILYLTTFLDDEYIIQALNIGAKGYILKQDFESIVPAMDAVMLGQSVFGGEIIEKIPKLMQKKDVFDYEKHGITEKEVKIIQAVAEGLNNKEIAETFALSEGTVRNYLSLILEKLELRDRTQLAIYYYKNMQ